MNVRTAKVTGWSLVGLTAILVAPALAIGATNPPPRIPVRASLELQASIELVAFAFAIFAAFSLVGVVIISNRQDNALGWLFVANGPVGGLIVLSYTYAYRSLAGDPGSLPAGRVAAWFSDITAPVILCSLTVFLFLLFPDGRLRTKKERATAGAAIAGIGLCMLGGVVEPRLFDYPGLATPLRLGVPAWVSSALYTLGYSAIFGSVIASVVILLGRLRRAVGRERDQLRLLVWASVVAALLFSPSFVLPSLVESYASPWLFFISALAVLLVPIAVGVAILRHRLLDIDLVIRRTVVIAILGVFITVVYVGVVVGVGALVGGSGNVVLSAVAAAVVAVAFQPVRRSAQRYADRLVFGDRATPYEVLHAFSERVAGSYETDDVLPRMAAILGQGTGAERAQVWLRIGQEFTPTAVWPQGSRRSIPVVAPIDEVPRFDDVSHAVAVRDKDELLGALTVTRAASEPLTSMEIKLLEDLALQAGLVLRNVRLVEELRSSRQRLVAAQDEERRKLERDIHDGAQQQLVALAVKVQLADRVVDADAEKAHRILAEVRGETQDALETLRDLARGIYPPLLADKGLATALEAQARKSPLHVEVVADGVGRYPPELEATGYFCCLEALQNAAKYSQASSVRVELSATNAELSFEVSDDGLGFDPDTTPPGSGLQNMTDRLEAVGGALTISSSPGSGTTLLGRIPLIGGGR